MFRWIQMPIEDVKQFIDPKSDSITLGSGYKYNDNGVEVVEFCMDALHMLDVDKYVKTPYGGNASA